MKSKTKKPAPATMPRPSQFNPADPTEQFVGPAQMRARVMFAKATRARAEGGNMKVLLFGAPGSGKTSIAEMTARLLANHSTEIERVNGRNVTVDQTRSWMESVRYQSILGGWTVRLIDEIDLCTPQAQDLLLSYLDQLPASHAVIGTSNLDLSSLNERFQTRFQQMRVALPSTDDIAELLMRWPVDVKVAQAIAVGSGGNVRAALLDLETYLDEMGAR